MLSALHLSHLILRSRLRRGGIAVDATAGNGHDTIFLARHIGTGGRVEAFDVEPAALTATRRRLDAASGGLAAVTLHSCGHERAGGVLAAAGIGAIDAAMFNLGYLPGSDKGRITTPGTTLDALTALAALLGPDGLITVVVYLGHTGGPEERDAVVAWTARLPADTFAAWQYRDIVGKGGSPELIVIEKPDRQAAANRYRCP